MAVNQISSLRMNSKFKKTPLGEIPVEWEAVHIEEVADVSGGGTPDRQNSEFWGGAIPWLTPTELTNLKSPYISDSRERITESGLKNSAANVLPAGSILLTTRATIGSCAINLVPMTTNQGFTNFTCGERINNLFLYYTLAALKKDLERLGAGSTFLEIPKSAIRRMHVSLPSIDEQKKIAEILSSVDHAIEKADAVIAKTQDLKKGLMQRLLTRGIGHTKFKKTPIGEIPVEWEAAKLGLLCLETPEYGANASAIQYQEGLPRYVRITDVMEKGLLTQDDKKSIPRELATPYLLLDGDFLFARSGATVGKTYLYRISDGECAFAGYMIRFRPNRKILLPEFLFQLTHSDFYYQWVKGMLRAGAQPNINGSEYSEFLLPTPPIDEQKKIVEILSSVDEAIEKSVSERNRLEQTKKSLMADLLTGQIRVKV